MATSFATPELAQAWNDRKLELQMERFQKYNDLLYARLVQKYTHIRPFIDAELHACVERATSPSDLHIMIDLYDYRWTVQDMTDKYSMSYYAIIKHTDLLDRLSLFFGGEHFVVRQSKHDDTRYQFTLYYYPDGVNEQQKLHMERCTRDHVGREQAFVRDVEWCESYTHRQEGGYATPPRPLAPFLPPPPPAPLRRGYAIRQYSSVEDAARDLGEELLRECYCQHGSDSE